MSNQQVEALEARFAAQSNKVNEKVLDLNCSMSDVATMAKGLMTMRNQLMGMYGVPADPEWNPNPPAVVRTASTSGITPPAGAKGAAIKPPSGALVTAGAALQTMAPDDVNWKGLLNTAIGRTHKAVVSKEALVYTVTGSALEGGFMCTVSSSSFLKQEYSSGAPCPSKKAAETAAAMAAVQAEYADCMVPSVPKRKAVAISGADGGTAACDKSAVGSLVQAVLGRPLTKQDVTYTVDDQGNGTFIGSVAFPGVDPGQSFMGAAASSKKAAENEAAKACLPWLQGISASAVAQKPKKAKKAPTEQQAQKAAAQQVVHAAKTPGAQNPVRQAVHQQFGGAQQFGMQSMVNNAMAMMNMGRRAY